MTMKRFCDCLFVIEESSIILYFPHDLNLTVHIQEESLRDGIKEFRIKMISKKDLRREKPKEKKAGYVID